MALYKGFIAVYKSDLGIYFSRPLSGSQSLSTGQDAKVFHVTGTWLEHCPLEIKMHCLSSAFKGSRLSHCKVKTKQHKTDGSCTSQQLGHLTLSTACVGFKVFWEQASWRDFLDWVNWGRRPNLNVGGALPWAGFLDWTKRKRSWAPVSISCCFLTVDVIWPAPFYSCCHISVMVMVCTPTLWANEYPSFLKLPFISNQRN